MPSNASKRTTSTSKKLARLGIAILAGIALWTIGWYVVAAKIIDHVPQTLAKIVGQNATADCTNPNMRGYPFRFGLFCDSVTYASTKDNLTIKTGEFRSAAQFYRPDHIVAELDGPLALSAKGISGKADWQLLHTSMFLTPNSITRGSLEAKTINIDLDGMALIQKLSMQADTLQAHARQNENDLDIAAHATELQNSLAPNLPVKAISLEATLPGKAALLTMPFEIPSGALDITLHRAAIELDDISSITITGQLQKAQNGQLSGNIDVTIRNYTRFLDLATEFNPGLEKTIRQIAPFVSALDTVPGDDAITLPLTIRDGRMSIGFIPLGRLPAF